MTRTRQQSMQSGVSRYGVIPHYTFGIPEHVHAFVLERITRRFLRSVKRPAGRMLHDRRRDPVTSTKEKSGAGEATC